MSTAPSTEFVLMSESRINWPLLLLGGVLAIIVPIGIHEYMLSGLGVPYPSRAGIPAIVIGCADVLARLMLLFSLSLASDSFKKRPLWVRCLWVSLVFAGLNETFRGIFMNGFVTTAYAFNFLIAIPLLICQIALSSGITVLESLRTPWWIKIAGTILLVVVFAWLEPWLETTMALESYFSGLSHAAIYNAPYGWVVNLPSTLTFVEPVVATFFIYLALKNRLGATRVRRLLNFTLLILLMRKMLFAFFVYGLYSKLGYPAFMLAQSQFLMEWAALALIAAATIEWSIRHRDGVSDPTGRSVV